MKTLVVIGGGAAGFFCAVNAARMHPHLRVIILEKTNALLSKVKVSGGGRCNVTRATFDMAEMSKGYPRGANFVKKTFHQFFTKDTIKWFEERGVTLKAESDGRMFPITNSSQTIIDCLLDEASKYNVVVRLKQEVKRINITDSVFSIETHDYTYKADYLCITTGGVSKRNNADWLYHLGHTIEPPIPSIFTFNLQKHPITQLMGISVVDVKVKVVGTKFSETGPVLITHWGLSGPAILKLSAYAALELAKMNYTFSIVINWISKYQEQEARDLCHQYRKTHAAKSIFNTHVFQLPNRLWHFLLQASEIDEDTKWADLPSKKLNLLIQNLAQYNCSVNGKTTFKEEFVTAGGIALSEVNHHTMMSKLVPNLFFAGEILNIDGITGGYNFQNAWTTAHNAAVNIIRMS